MAGGTFCEFSQVLGRNSSLAQVVQRICDCSISGRVQGQLGQGLETPGTLEGVPAMAGGRTLRSLPRQIVL